MLIAREAEHVRRYRVCGNLCTFLSLFCEPQSALKVSLKMKASPLFWTLSLLVTVVSTVP